MPRKYVHSYVRTYVHPILAFWLRVRTVQYWAEFARLFAAQLMYRQTLWIPPNEVPSLPTPRIFPGAFTAWIRNHAKPEISKPPLFPSHSSIYGCLHGGTTYVRTGYNAVHAVNRVHKLHLPRSDRPRCIIYGFREKKGGNKVKGKKPELLKETAGLSPKVALAPSLVSCFFCSVYSIRISAHVQCSAEIKAVCTQLNEYIGVNCRKYAIVNITYKVRTHKVFFGLDARTQASHPHLGVN